MSTQKPEFPPGSLQSPCVGVCRLDAETGWCIACLRSGDEIRRWITMTDQERRDILGDRARRLARLAPR